METNGDCGHLTTTHDGPGAGYGIDPKSGIKYCYGCCAHRDLDSVLAAKDGDKFYGYMSRIGNRTYITNWPGAPMIRVTYTNGYRVHAPNAYSSTPMVSWEGRDGNGHRWYGRCQGEGVYATAKKAKQSAKTS